MQITLYKFSKKINSTARPTSGGTIVNAEIKSNVPVANSFDQSADTYLTNPVFFLSTIDSAVSGDVGAYNYVLAFNNYYWIRNIEISLNNAYTLFCEIDALATHRNDIIGSTQYISYASAGYNRNIDDTRLHFTNNITKALISNTNIIPGLTNGPRFAQYHMILTTDNGTFPCFMSPNQFSTFITNFLSHNRTTPTDLQNIFGAPIYCIGAMHGMYYEYQGDTTLLSVDIGGQNYGQAYFPNASSYKTVYQIDIDNTVPLEKRGARCTEYFINLPMVGMVKCENGMINSSQYLRASFMVDAHSLDVGYYVRDDDGLFVAEGYGNVGQEIMFGQIINPNTAAGTYYMYDLADWALKFGASTAASAVNLGGEFALKSPGAGRALDNLGNTITSQLTQPISSMLKSDMAGYAASVSRSGTRGGANSGALSPIANHNLALYAYSSEYVIEPSQAAYYFGRPVFAVQQIVGDGRLVICPNPIIELDTVSGIITQIIKLMKGGIYAE